MNPSANVDMISSPCELIGNRMTCHRKRQTARSVVLTSELCMIAWIVWDGHATIIMGPALPQSSPAQP
eukprot:scaffold570_cov169-Alexandrium_tamarense.AAC.16